MSALLASPAMSARLTGPAPVMPQPVVAEPIPIPMRRVPDQAHAVEAAQQAQHTRFDMPLQADYRLSSAFGMRLHPIRKQQRLHAGADLAAPRGTPVHAVADGIVSAVRSTPDGYGRLIVVTHPDGYSSWYAHMDRFEPDLRVGQSLQRGARLGTVGDSGAATGPHLHLEIRLDKVPVDPMALLPPEPAMTAPVYPGPVTAWRQHASPP